MITKINWKRISAFFLALAVTLTICFSNLYLSEKKVYADSADSFQESPHDIFITSKNYHNNEVYEEYSNSLKLMAISLAICSALLLGITINDSKANANDNLVPIYRLYNNYNKEHLYTSDAHEKDVLYSQYGWGYEGVGWYAPKGGTPVYRLYNGSLHNHLYTTDLNEIKTLTNKYGWVMDNNGNPLFYSGGNVGIYRLYLPTNNGLHHMTTDTREYNVLPGLQGWKQEGLKLYAAKVGNKLDTTNTREESKL